MERPNPKPGQGTPARQPGNPNQGDVGSDPRRTREEDENGENDSQIPERDQRQDEVPRAG